MKTQTYLVKSSGLTKSNRIPEIVSSTGRKNFQFDLDLKLNLKIFFGK